MGVITNKDRCFLDFQQCYWKLKQTKEYNLKKEAKRQFIEAIDNVIKYESYRRIKPILQDGPSYSRRKFYSHVSYFDDNDINYYDVFRCCVYMLEELQKDLNIKKREMGYFEKKQKLREAYYDDPDDIPGVIELAKWTERC